MDSSARVDEIIAELYRYTMADEPTLSDEQVAALEAEYETLTGEPWGGPVDDDE